MRNLKLLFLGFPSGSVVKNLPANAGAAGSIPGSGRFPWRKKNVEPAGLCGRCTGVAVPLRVVPSPTGLPSKRGVTSIMPDSVNPVDCSLPGSRVQAAVAAREQEGLVELFHVQGQEGRR